MPDAILRLNDALSGRYTIERELGEGGMATVYLAKDLKHHRNVAIKVLKPELTAVVGAERFLAEIRTTANLHHPLILPLFDSGEADGLLYYVMPYVEGESLRDLLDREGRLGLDDALRIAADVAEALQAAHEQGVVHRDIKPGNVLISRGRSLVADFGIARAAEAPETTRLTTVGASLGTAGYMSPEQAAGDEEVDHRSDIYALACMLYEMLGGEPPYAAPSMIAMLAKQATEPVPSIRQLLPDVPAGLERALTIALAKAPGDRFESAAAFRNAMTASRDETPEADQPKTVVVLPFANRSHDPEHEYFSDGLTEEVISDLSRVSALRVISRNSAMALKGTTKDTPTLARELGVSHLVTGSVRRAGEALRVTAELVEAKTDAPVWSEKYSGTTEDVFGIQEEISRQIVDALEVVLTEAEKEQVHERPIENVLAYDCYLHARQEMYAWTPDAPRRAIQMVDDALAIAGDGPLLLAMKGQLYWTQVNQNLIAVDEGLEQASHFVDRALALDSAFPLAIYVRGLIAGARGQPEQALPDLYRAHQMSPGDANILAEVCRYSNTSGLRGVGRLAELLERIDPLPPITSLVTSSYHWVNGNHEQAAESARRSIARALDASMLHIYAGWQLASAGYHDEARDALGRVVTSLRGTSTGEFALFLEKTLEGRADEALLHMTPEVESTMHNEFSTRITCDAYAHLGHRDQALRWLRTSIDRGFINYPSWAEHDPFLEGLRDDSEFKQIMAELKPRWETVVEWERSLAPHS